MSDKGPEITSPRLKRAIEAAIEGEEIDDDDDFVSSPVPTIGRSKTFARLAAKPTKPTGIDFAAAVKRGKPAPPAAPITPEPPPYVPPADSCRGCGVVGFIRDKKCGVCSFENLTDKERISRDLKQAIKDWRSARIADFDESAGPLADSLIDLIEATLTPKVEAI